MQPLNMKTVYLYKLTRTDDHDEAWDIYDSCIVTAYSEEDAKLVHPSGNDQDYNFSLNEWFDGRKYNSRIWPSVQFIKVELIGTTEPNVKPNQVILASFWKG